MIKLGHVEQAEQFGNCVVLFGGSGVPLKATLVTKSSKCSYA